MGGSDWVSPPGSNQRSSTGKPIDISDYDYLEEIGLDDNDPDAEVSTRGRQPAPQRNSNPTTLRDLTQIKRSQYPSLGSNTMTTTSTMTNGHSHLVDHLGPPITNGSRRLSSAPSYGNNRAPSRSNSPGPPSTPHSPNLMPMHANGAYRPKISPTINPRRTSWQSHRKTVEELEEEYDSDDDIPPDTIFYNVPVSPRSARALSAAPSPERKCMKLEANGTDTPPLSRPPTRGGEVSTSPVLINGEAIESRGQPELRSKSWSDAMSELGPEAKELSEALERHADMEEERMLRKRVEPLRKKSPSRTTVVELPPLQRTNGMIDPLPISKEKEAVLSRTRPSWLPPKSKEEEKRHLREYQKMMRLSQESERKRLEKERFEQEQRERLKDDLFKVWDQHIIPNFTKMTRKSETRELWWRGVAPRCRGTVWQLSFGNHLAASADTYRLALKRAKTVELTVGCNPNLHSGKERDLFSAIRRDVDRTFEELKIFQKNGPLHESLLDVLMAYSMYRSDVGYVYGTHTVAGLLLLNLTPEQAFVTLANLLNRPLPLAFYTQDEGAMSRVYNLFLKAFKYKLPSLHQHINQTLRLPPSAYLEPMFLTLFSLHCPLDLTARIWDVYSFEGDSFLVRTAVGVLTVLESRLYGNREEVLKVLGWGAPKWELGTEDVFMQVVRDAGKEES
ncbi:hypothetical protein RUND412_002229 [Rhizina undulata]